MHNIFRKLIAPVAMAMLLLPLLGACTDDFFGEDGARERVNLRLKVILPSMNVMTRSDISEGLDQRVESLWIGIYKAGATGERTGSVAVSNPKSESHNDTQADVEIPTLTGDSYIVAVANYENRYAIDDKGNQTTLAQALEDATDWKKFQEISVLLNQSGLVTTDVPVNPLLMSGHYMEGTHPDGSFTEIQPVKINRTGSLSGSVHLRRVISQVRFNVTYNTDNISDFEILGWSVHNVPNQSWLAERGSGTLNSGDVRTAASGEDSFQSTAESVQVNPSGSTYSFDWWQVENKRTGLTPPASMTDPYQYREKEFKDANGNNTGKYSSLVPSATSVDPNNNATFVELKVRMTLKVDENGNSLTGSKMRVYDGVYTVHLGYCEGSGAAKAMDFNARRNTRYTYNVTINNVKNVMVEADSDVENNPGAEGIVSDVTEQFMELDAHYGVCNIYLSDSDLEVFDYLIRAYDENGNMVVIDSKIPSSVPASSNDRRKYLNWIELRASSRSSLAAYRPHGESGTYYLDEFKAGIENNTIKSGYYTMFFNEYVYESTTNGNESTGQAWRTYVNKPDRQAWIRVLEHKSSDGESSYFQSKYAFSQKSIQTYYDISSSGSTTALGMEHINESYGLNLRASKHGSNADNGRLNSANFIQTTTSWRNNRYSWSTHVDQTRQQTVNAINNQGVSLPATTYGIPALEAYTGSVSSSTYDPDQNYTRKYIEAINACNNRNRDLDGDGYIDANEVRWYVPTTNQIIRMILGRRSLVKPIMDYAGNPNLPNSSTGEVPSLIMYGSDGKVIWGMEGTSTSSWGNYYSGTPWNVRCVRNLGTNMNQTSFTTTTQAAYRARSGATNTVEMIYYDSKSVRMEKMQRIIPHHIADQDYNRVYKAFQYSSELSLKDLNGYDTYGSDWTTWLRSVNPCSGVSGLTGTGWRIPNQKEIIIMLTLGVKPSALYMPSATFSFYDISGKGSWSNAALNDDRFKVMCTTYWGNGTQQTYGDILGNIVVRCVRDVD